MFSKKTAIMLTTLFTLTGAILSGCGSSKAPENSSSADAAATAQPTEITLYVTSSQNVKDFWDTVIPKFEQQATDVKVKLVFTASGTGAQPTYDRIMAAKQANKGSGDIDIYEDTLATVTRGQQDGLWDTLGTDKIPNLSKVDAETMKDIANMAVPYRASAVVLAYNSDKVKTPPANLDELYAWIKANPQRFAYNDPSTGGSGNSFVTTSLYKTLPADAIHNSDPSIVKQWDQGIATLKDLGKYVYGNGIYPKKNQGTLDLLASGEVDMIPAWSDMVLDQVSKGQLPESIKMAQITPGFNGGPAYLMVNQLSTKKEAIYKFLNYVLSPEAQSVVANSLHGFPGIQMTNMPQDVQDAFKGAASGFRTFNIGALDKEVNKRWQSEVAAQ
ncbi:extracellular solute-binding protein [Paenibacillus sp. 7124]|uniref:Extracellular solute-binding protein n=1 Tax=Paenibacillus apii TaxID=1850370 RepID=A0A6M1PHX2_9BACL|nr:extracellular solute-binding protein [Paenibacillus apii]NGM82002.1 extracellular solute-binding protein [Paenibacillus apii]NJJ39132.1 extracellular solute-binding protein [Paenibacillus apii]